MVSEDVMQPERPDEPGAETPEEPGKRSARLRELLRRIGRLIARPWSRAARALAWLVRPDEVGKPLTLQPRGLRLLLLLILGNLAVLVSLTVVLYWAATAPPRESPPQIVIATPSPAPSPTAGPSPTPFGSGGAIAFTLRRSGNADVYALNQTDRQLVRLTHDLAEDRDPAWSPDGEYIAFASNRAHNWDIYLLDLVSGQPIRLTRDSSFDANPSWSPDGEHIAFESYRHGSLDIYTMSKDGRQVQRITSNRAPDYEPAWSPGGQAIAFTSFRDGNKDIHLYLIEERRSINITNSPDIDEDDPSWSPDGTQLAYVSGPRGNRSIQVTTFDWESLKADQTQSELFGTGASPAWAPDGQTLIYTFRRGEFSYITAASMKGWGLFHEVYSTGGLMDDLTWTRLALSPRVVARAQAADPGDSYPFYAELVQPTPAIGPPYSLVPLPNVNLGGDEGEGEEEEGEEENETFCLMADRVDESFDALRQRVVEEAGWDYLANLSSSWRPMTYTPPTGHSRMSWHVCGRAIGLDREPYEEDDPQIELIREDVGNVTYWRVFVRTAEQDGSMGEPLREAVWDLYAREEGGRAAIEGGAPRARIPSGYYVDFTTLASDYGWERLPALWRWRYFWPDVRWWEFQKTDDLTWWECMLEVFEPEEIEDAFGPLPGYKDQ